MPPQPERRPAVAGAHRGGPAPGADRLSLLGVIVDGTGPLVDCVATALRACGVGRVIGGRYAAESLGWTTPPPTRRGRRVAHVDEALTVAAVIAVTHGALDPLVAAPWHRAGILHLPLEVHDGWVQVGPLVIPGVSACLGCRARTTGQRERPVSGVASSAGAGWRDADPLGIGSTVGPAPDPGVAVLAAAVAGLTVRQALNGDHSLAGISCDIVGSRPEIVHRYWRAHPDCRCVSGTARSA